MTETSTLPAPVTGLLARGAPVPLRGVTVESLIRDVVARVTITQRYRNDEAAPIEAVYVFPLDELAAVCGFEAMIDTVHVVGTVLERDQAFKEYDDAMAAGHGAYLLDQERPDVLTASIGNVPPGADVLVRVTYVTELAVEGDDLRFTLPTTVSPRYAPAADRVGVGPTPAERLNPPVEWSVPYGLDLRLTLEMAGPLRGVESPTHAIGVDIDGATATVRLARREAALDGDFVLVLKGAAARAPRITVEIDEGGTTGVLVSFHPELKATQTSSEVVFLVDCSGSMDGTSIAEARNALQLFLRSLTPGASFNIVRFGSSFQALFPESRGYDNDTLAEASRYVEQMRADLGGTEILPAIEHVMRAEPRPGVPRQLFVLTDGQVTNSDEVIAAVRRHAHTTRVFTFGIGAGASVHLVRGIARAGEGAAELIAPGERIEAKVMRQLARALAPALTDVKVEWGGLSITQAPHFVPPVFSGGRVHVYGLARSLSEVDVVLHARTAEGPVAFTQRLDPTAARAGRSIATLAARGLIRDLEEGMSPMHDRRGSLQNRGDSDRVKREIVRLGTTFGLLSRETSYVAVEKRRQPTEGELQLRRVPIALTREWGGLERSRLIVGADAAAHSGSFLAPPRAALHSMDLGREFEAMARFEAARAQPLSAPSAPAPPRGGRPSIAERARTALRNLTAGRSRPLDSLVRLQQADGSWKLDRELLELLGVSTAQTGQALDGTSVSRATAERALATALALAWLERHEYASRDEWILLALKAEEWLARQPVPAPGRTWIDLARTV